MEPKAEPAGKLFQGQQTGIRLNPQFVELVELVAHFAGFRRLLLSPTALDSQLTEALGEAF